jgi:hypothetical protein
MIRDCRANKMREMQKQLVQTEKLSLGQGSGRRALGMTAIAVRASA